MAGSIRKFNTTDVMVTFDVTTTYSITLAPTAFKAAMTQAGVVLTEPEDVANMDDAAEYFWALLDANPGVERDAFLTSEGTREGAEDESVEITETQDA